MLSYGDPELSVVRDSRTPGGNTYVQELQKLHTYERPACNRASLCIIILYLKDLHKFEMIIDW